MRASASACLRRVQPPTHPSSIQLASFHATRLKKAPDSGAQHHRTACHTADARIKDWGRGSWLHRLPVDALQLALRPCSRPDLPGSTTPRCRRSSSKHYRSRRTRPTVAASKVPSWLKDRHATPCAQFQANSQAMRLPTSTAHPFQQSRLPHTPCAGGSQPSVRSFASLPGWRPLFPYTRIAVIHNQTAQSRARGGRRACAWRANSPLPN